MSTHEEPVRAFPVEGKTFGPVAEVPRLQRGALNLVDIATSTMANIAPAMSFFFSFALIAAVAGVASPLTIVVAMIAIALLGNTLAEFSRSIPSTGSFITFIGKTFGPVLAITTTLVVSLGYIIAMASVVDISGGWTQIIFQHYLSITVPWQPLTLILTAIVFYLMVRGVNLSTRWAGFFFLLEMAVLVVVSVSALVTNAAHLSLAPFSPANIKGGLAGLGLGFPVAVYMFIGWGATRKSLPLSGARDGTPASVQAGPQSLRALLVTVGFKARGNVQGKPAHGRTGLGEDWTGERK